MALVFCIFCGNHDVCPEEFGGGPTCDMCGRPGLMPCGKCEACTGGYDQDQDDDDESDYFNDEDY